MNAIMYEDEAERRQHQDSIQILAKELKLAETDVAEVYESVLMSFKNRVTIIHYLPIFVPRRVRQIFVTGLISHTGLFSGPPPGSM
ncbi:MAG TPA: hypothetical protein VMB77_10270 [Syntrophales bacterium]|nr:hypothetical protein [Syntrophales bacterium]